MNLRQFAILEAMNIATARHMHNGAYRATAKQISDVLRDDPRLSELPWLNPRAIGAMLGDMASERERSEALVEKVTTRHWCMTRAGVRTLCA